MIHIVAINNTYCVYDLQGVVAKSIEVEPKVVIFGHADIKYLHNYCLHHNCLNFDLPISTNFIPVPGFHITQYRNHMSAISDANLTWYFST